MKYIDADKLTTIIEERKAQQDQWIDRYNDPVNHVISQELTEILSVITSLQQEQPEVELEKELENYFKGWHVEEDLGLTKPDGWSCIVDDLKDIARHFYELGLNAKKVE